MSEATIRGGRVMVIDDDAMIRTVLRRALEPEHHEVVAYDSAKRALEHLLTDHDFDIVFCDLAMPQMNGVELVRALELQLPAILPKLLLVTGGAYTPDLQRLLESVTTARIEKPFDVIALRALVAERVRLRTALPPG